MGTELESDKTQVENLSPSRYTPPILRTMHPETSQACGAYAVTHGNGTAKSNAGNTYASGDAVLHKQPDDDVEDIENGINRPCADSKRVSFDENLERVLEIPGRLKPEPIAEEGEDDVLSEDEHPAVRGHALSGNYTLSKSSANIYKPKKLPNRGQTKKNAHKPQLQQRRNNQNTKSINSYTAFKSMNSVYSSVHDLNISSKYKSKAINSVKIKTHHSSPSEFYNNKSNAVNKTKQDTHKHSLTPKSTIITQYEGGVPKASTDTNGYIDASSAVSNSTRTYFPEKPVSAQRRYAWQLANGAQPPEALTPSISPMWDFSSRYNDIDGVVLGGMN